MGRRQGSLLKDATERVLSAFTRLSREGRADVKVLSASVADNDGSDSIDFLDEHLIVRDSLDLPDGDPERNYRLRADFLSLSFNNNLPYIHELYGP
jgi:hypothetical protein